MRCHKIEATRNGTVVAVRYAGTTALARAVRDGLVESLGIQKKHIMIEPAEIPTPKDQLLDFVNELSMKLDVREPE